MGTFVHGMELKNSACRLNSLSEDLCIEVVDQYYGSFSLKSMRYTRSELHRAIIACI